MKNATAQAKTMPAATPAKAAPVTPVTANAQAVAATAPAQVTGTVQVKAGLTYRGARESWYKRLLEFNGKPLADLIASAEKSPPSLLTARSKNAGKPEATSGWLRFFKRQGVLTITE